MAFLSDGHDDGRVVPVLEDLSDVSGRRALVRATFDRPLADDPARPLAQLRAKGLAATVEWLCGHGARVTVCGDTGTSDDAAAGEALRQLRQAVDAASPVTAAAGGAVTFAVAPEDPDEVGALVRQHDVFVNDTLQDSFIPVPSLALPPTRLPGAVGRTLQHDLGILDACLLDPARPFVVVLGGERSFDRLHGLQGLILRADTVLLGGALAIPMLKAVGSHPAGDATETFLWECRTVVGLSHRVRHQLSLPVDLVWRTEGAPQVAPAAERAGTAVVDIGPLTRIRFAETLAGARSILWAGAVGMVEGDAFTEGTTALAAGLPPSASVVLGGDALVTGLHAAGLLPDAAKMLSATDAAVEILKNGDLPALAALRRH